MKAAFAFRKVLPASSQKTCVGMDFFFASFLNGWFFLFPSFCLETKGGAQNSRPIQSGYALGPSVVSVNRPLPTTLLWLGLMEQVSSPCCAGIQKPLYSANYSLRR